MIKFYVTVIFLLLFFSFSSVFKNKIYLYKIKYQILVNHEFKYFDF